MNLVGLEWLGIWIFTGLSAIVIFLMLTRTPKEQRGHDSLAAKPGLVKGGVPFGYRRTPPGR